MSKAIWMTVIDGETVKTTATVTSDPIEIGFASAFGYKITVDSGSAPDINLIYQVIESGQGDGALVGGAEDVRNGFAWITPTTGSTLVENLTSGSKANGFSPMPTRWLRLAVVGQAANGDDTVATVKISLYWNN